MKQGLMAMIATLAIALCAGGQDSLPPLLLTSRSDSASPTTSLPAQPLRLTVPGGTEISVHLLSGIHTQVNHVDDPVRALLLHPVYINGHIALPSGSLLDGRITKIRSAGRLNRPAELSLRFERIILPNGQAEPIRAALTRLNTPRSAKTRLDPEGILKGSQAFSWKRVVGGLAALGTFTTAKVTLAGSAALAPLLPVSGAAVVGYAFVWPRGNEVHLPPETPARIRLVLPLTVRTAG